MSSGFCFWEKTSNGCTDEDDTFTHDAYDFYELCRAGERKGATFHCEKAPAKLGEGECKDRDDGVANINGHRQKESSSGETDDNHDDYHYLDNTTKKKFCFDCEQRRWMCRAFGCRGICRSVLKGMCDACRGIFSA